MLNVGADLNNRAGAFVAEDARRRDSTVLDFFDIGGANTADGDLDKQFVLAEARDGNGFEAEIVDTAIDDGAHGFGNGEHAGRLTAETQRRRENKRLLLFPSLRLCASAVK